MCSSGLEAHSCPFSTKFFRSRDLRFTTSPAIATYTLLPHVLSFRLSLLAWARAYFLASFGLREGIERLANVYDLMCWVFTSLNISSILLSFLLRCWRWLVLAFRFLFRLLKQGFQNPTLF
jgi:hypothetical protein